MITPISERYLPHTQTALRVVAGAAYFVHGAQKSFGWFGGMGPTGSSVDFMSKYGVAGAVEVVLGICLVLGLMTRLAAFLASGEMAAAYFEYPIDEALEFRGSRQGEMPLENHAIKARQGADDKAGELGQKPPYCAHGILPGLAVVSTNQSGG